MRELLKERFTTYESIDEELFKIGSRFPCEENWVLTFLTEHQYKVPQAFFQLLFSARGGYQVPGESGFSYHPSIPVSYGIIFRLIQAFAVEHTMDLLSFEEQKKFLKDIQNESFIQSLGASPQERIFAIFDTVITRSASTAVVPYTKDGQSGALTTKTCSAGTAVVPQTKDGQSGVVTTKPFSAGTAVVPHTKDGQSGAFTTKTFGTDFDGKIAFFQEFFTESKKHMPTPEFIKSVRLYKGQLSNSPFFASSSSPIAEYRLKQLLEQLCDFYDKDPNPKSKVYKEDRLNEKKGLNRSAHAGMWCKKDYYPYPYYDRTPISLQRSLEMNVQEAKGKCEEYLKNANSMLNSIRLESNSLEKLMSCWAMLYEQYLDSLFYWTEDDYGNMADVMKKCQDTLIALEKATHQDLLKMMTDETAFGLLGLDRSTITLSSLESFWEFETDLYLTRTKQDKKAGVWFNWSQIKAHQREHLAYHWLRENYAFPAIEVQNSRDITQANFLEMLKFMGIPEEKWPSIDSKGLRAYYRQAARLHHPDKVVEKNSSAIKEATISFQRLFEFKETLLQLKEEKVLLNNLASTKSQSTATARKKDNLWSDPGKLNKKPLDEAPAEKVADRHESSSATYNGPLFSPKQQGEKTQKSTGNWTELMKNLQTQVETAAASLEKKKRELQAQFEQPTQNIDEEQERRCTGDNWQVVTMIHQTLTRVAKELKTIKIDQVKATYTSSLAVKYFTILRRPYLSEVALFDSCPPRPSENYSSLGAYYTAELIESMGDVAELLPAEKKDEFEKSMGDVAELLPAEEEVVCSNIDGKARLFQVTSTNSTTSAPVSDMPASQGDLLPRIKPS